MSLRLIREAIPDMYVPTVYDVDYRGIYNMGIRYAIFDVDDTLLSSDDMVVTPTLFELFDYVQNEVGFNTCLVSNSSEKRVSPVAELLHTGYVAKARKPSSRSFRTVEQIFLDKNGPNKMVFIGDSVFLDMIYARRFQMFKVLVDSIRGNRWNLKTISNDCVHAVMKFPLKKAGFEFGKHYVKKQKNNS